ncbi:MAG: hypothetical protein FWH14_08280 [Oscillospiraceae bacterium]|nr:hypothetical protein [Oscillospiraceae bacterium]
MREYTSPYRRTAAEARKLAAERRMMAAMNIAEVNRIRQERKQEEMNLAAEAERAEKEEFRRKNDKTRLSIVLRRMGMSIFIISLVSFFIVWQLSAVYPVVTSLPGNNEVFTGLMGFLIYHRLEPLYLVICVLIITGLGMAIFSKGKSQEKGMLRKSAAMALAFIILIQGLFVLLYFSGIFSVIFSGLVIPDIALFTIFFLIGFSGVIFPFILLVKGRLLKHALALLIIFVVAAFIMINS